jgi:predicted nucleotidyltransferase
VRIFGSVARGEDTAGSDLDLLAVLPPRTGLIGVSRLALQLEDILGVPVDIVSDRGHGRVLDNARSQAIPL